MSTIETIRLRLGVTQQALATVLGCTQSNIGQYKRGQTLPPERALRLVAFAKERGMILTLEQVYGAAPLNELAGATQESVHA